MDTSIERRRDAVRFLVASADHSQADALVRMGYQTVGPGKHATAWFPDAPEISSYFEHFSASIDQMIMQKTRAIAVPWQDALIELLGRVESTNLDWWLYGSAGLAVRGFVTEPGDIDIHVSDPWLAGRIFGDVLVTPVLEMENWVAAYSGRAFSHTIIEWLSAPYPELDDASAPHEQGPYIAGVIETIEWRGHQIRVPPVAAQLRARERR